MSISVLSYNTITLVGRMGRDPETRYTPNGKPVTDFSMATDKVYQKDGQQQKDTTWFRCTVWGERMVEVISQKATKGTVVMVTGELSQRAYTDRDGNAKTSLEVNVRDARLFLEKESDGGYSDGAGGQYAGRASKPTAAPVSDESPFGDLPFHHPPLHRLFADTDAAWAPERGL